MTSITWTDRSRIECYQHCARERWLRYHEGTEGRGIESVKLPLPLAVGKSVHKGLESLLTDAMNVPGPWGMDVLHEDTAVVAALDDFAQHRSALALDLAESSAIAAEVEPSAQGFDAQVIATARDLGMAPDDPAMAELLGRQRNAAAEFDDWLWREQAALVEAMIRAYARRRLGPLLAEFEVLEVEREGDWELASLDSGAWYCDNCNKRCRAVNGGNPPACFDCACPVRYVASAIRFMSRPDALLRSRSDNSLYLLSYKTAATWDIRKARDVEHDMQGLSEGIEVERRLGEWWQQIQDKRPFVYRGYGAMTEAQAAAAGLIPTVAIVKYLMSIPAPPRILGIRYEFLLKGSRWEDKELSRRFGIRVWSQRSPLIRRYVAHSTPSRGKNASAFDIGSVAWSWDYHLEDGSATKLSASNWHSEPVWDGPTATTIRAWIDDLDATAETLSAYDSTTGAEPRSLGWSGPAQSLGYTSAHPLDEVFPAPLIVYRSDDQLRDLVEQLESQETRVAEAVAAVRAAADDGERRSLLNRHFVQSRHACEYPSTCSMSRICWGGADIQADPVASGLYQVRSPNHLQEKDAVAAAETVDTADSSS